MASDEMNSVTGKKSVIFKGGAGRGRGMGEGGIEFLRRGEPVEPKQTLELMRKLILSDLNLSVVFLTHKKKRRRFWPGHDERFNLSDLN